MRLPAVRLAVTLTVATVVLGMIGLGWSIWDDYQASLAQIGHARDGAPLAAFWTRTWARAALAVVALALIGGLLLAFVRAAAREQRSAAEQRRLAFELRSATERTDLALSLLPIALFEHDTELRYTWFKNSQLPISDTEFVGRTHDDFYFNGAEIKRAVLDSGRPLRQDVKLLGRDGIERWFDLAMMPIRDQAGRIVGLRAASSVITAQKHHELELKAAKEAAERASRQKSHFLAAASHDLRQPMQALRIFLELLRDARDPALQPMLIEKSLEAFGGAERLLNALLDLSRFEAGVVQVHRDRIDIATFLRRLATETGAAAGEKGLRLRLRTCQGVVESDPILLERIVRNLVHNALKFTDRGGILIGCRRRVGKLRIEIWDTGRGIPGSAIEHVFDDFFQVDNAERDSRHGLGMGLAIVERAVRLLGHTIEIRSRLGRGTVVLLTLDGATPTPPVPQKDAIAAMM